MMPQPQNPDYEAAVRGLFARQGLMEAFGVALKSVAPGACTLAVDYHGTRARLQGAVQGALLGALADTAASLAVLTLVPKGNGVVTAEYKVSFLEPAIGEHVEGRARVRRFGRTLSLVEVDTVALDGVGAETLCAVSTHTVMRLEPEAEVGAGAGASPAARPHAAPAKPPQAAPPPKKKGLFRRG